VRNWIGEGMNTDAHAHNSSALRRYYAWQSRVYDATRWLFLFGRHALMRKLALRLPHAARVIEVGCGTGVNLVALAELRFDVQIEGVDLSVDMLAKAGKRVASFQGDFSRSSSRLDQIRLRCADVIASPPSEKYDAIVLSYMLSMTGTQCAQIIPRLAQQLKPGGVFAIVDFHDAPLNAFRRWMGVNHVSMDASLPSHIAHALGKTQLSSLSIKRAYGGVWRYFYCCESND
jgi:S-adenosylmethionine-diacylgycerolhomoserine-N-methlytransferase